MPRMLLIDDDPDFSQLLDKQLTQLGYEVRCFDDAQAGFHALAGETVFDVVLLDNRMPRMTGLEFLAALNDRQIDIPVILMTSVHKDETAIQATHLGAFSYVIKPLDWEKTLTDFKPEIEAALQIHRRPRPVVLPSAQAAAVVEESVIVGTSRPMLEVLKRIGRVARTAEPVLILGETGTGKDLVARAIHTNSRRAKKPFVVMNCAAFNDNLLDDELFGHEAGAFTGADKLRKGRFEHAHGGTLFLDEVGDMPLTLQVKLLRVLENREVVRLGSNEALKVDVRVISATHRDLKVAVRDGRFREDLYYRLEGMTIHLPPLRERKEDIKLLAECFLARILGGEPGPSFHVEAINRLINHQWPGNIRQLQKVVCRAVGACRGAQILPEDLDFGEIAAAANGNNADDADAAARIRAVVAWAWNSGLEKLWLVLQETFEKELLQFALSQPGISQVQLAKRLGIARNTLRARIEQYGLKLPAENDS